MQSLKTVWLLGILLIFQPSLVRCTSYSPKQILTCVEVLSKGIAEASKEIMPRLEELVKCIGFKPRENLDDLDTQHFRELVSAFLKQLVQGPGCLDTFAEGMQELIEPHKAQFISEKCFYLSSTPQCWPSK